MAAQATILFLFSSDIMRKLVLIGLLALLLESCGGVLSPEFVGVNSIDVTEVKLSKITANINVKVYNPNKHSITVKNADIDIAMRDIKTGKLEVSEPIKIAAQSYADCDFTIKMSTAETLKVGLSSAKEWFLNSSGIKLTGTIDGKYGIFNKKIKVDTTVKIGEIVPKTKSQQQDL